MDRLRREGAIWGLCALLVMMLAAALEPRLVEDLDPPPACAWPREAAAVRGDTVRVTCERPAGGGRPVRGPARWLFGLRIDLGRADARRLEALPGIGPARARAIVAERRDACFSHVDDLARVHGIGPRSVERLGPLLRVDPGCGLAAERASTGGAR